MYFLWSLASISYLAVFSNTVCQISEIQNYVVPINDRNFKHFVFLRGQKFESSWIPNLEFKFKVGPKRLNVNVGKEGGKLVSGLPKSGPILLEGLRASPSWSKLIILTTIYFHLTFIKIFDLDQIGKDWKGPSNWSRISQWQICNWQNCENWINMFGWHGMPSKDCCFCQQLGQTSFDIGLSSNLFQLDKNKSLCHIKIINRKK